MRAVVKALPDAGRHPDLSLPQGIERFQDRPPGAAGAAGGGVFLYHPLELAQDVVHFLAVQAVEVEVSGVQLATESGTLGQGPNRQHRLPFRGAANRPEWGDGM